MRGFGRLDGDEGFAEVFFDSAFVPDEAVPGGVVLGDVDQGWSVAMATTSSERGLTLRAPGRFTATADRLVDLYRQRSKAADTLDPALRDRYARTGRARVERDLTYDILAKRLFNAIEART